MYPRLLTRLVRESLADAPAVYLQGARQVGKSTLARLFPERRYLTLDNATTLASCGADPEGFLAGLAGTATLDEVQRVPSLTLAIKRAIDEDRRPGRFLMTGSAGLLVLPALADALVGRMEVLTLWPLAQVELSGRPPTFIDDAFGTSFSPLPQDGPELEDRLVRGGFPEAHARSSSRSRGRWFESYLATLLQREVRSLHRIEDLAALPRLLSLVAARNGALLNVADLSRASGIAQTTLKRYLAVLEGTFLTWRLPAWSTNLGKRLTRSPKHYVVD